MPLLFITNRCQRRPQEYHRKLKKAEKRKAGAGEEAGDEEALKRMMEEAEFERAKVCAALFSCFFPFSAFILILIYV
jgi:hypothetical protein